MGKWFKALNGMLCVRRKSSTSWVVLSIRACKILCPFWKVLYRCGIHLRQIISLTKWETYGSSRNRFFPPGVKRFFLLGAPIIALIIYWILPNTYTDIHNQVLPFNPHAKACLAVVVWMVLWWLFEPVPIPVTSLLPIPLFPLLGIAKPAQAMAPYASGTIFLFMGGFLFWRLPFSAGVWISALL